jgi:methionine synthase II (cobalamin-independent)
MRPSVPDALGSGAVFATLLGSLPSPPLAPDAPPADLVRATVDAQVAAGLEPVTDGAAPRVSGTVSAWRLASEFADAVAVKAALVGPVTRGGTAALAAVSAELADLTEAGCRLIELHEPAVIGRAFDPGERRAVVDAWRAALDGLADRVHVSLVLTGGDVTGLGRAIYDAPFASYGFDLRAGPDNWRVIADAPGDRGIVAGALAARAGSDDGPELLVWAAHYAASIAGRGLDRVGLATADSLAALPWGVAVAKMERLAAAAGIAANRSFADIAPHLDPRAAGMKSAALGRCVPPRRGRRRGP